MALSHMLAALLVAAAAGYCLAGELTVEDFTFDGPVGCQGARIEKIAANHFKVSPGPAPNRPEWNNYLQFQIVRNAGGKELRIDGEYLGSTQYAFFEWYYSWSYDGKNWQPIQWHSYSKKDGNATASWRFPRFEQDTVWVGALVPMSYEDMLELIEGWKKHPAVKVHLLGQSLGKKDILRVEVTEPNSPHPPSRRWVHYFANQHPLEHNSQWRMAGMVDWLLSEAGADARKRSICHFVLKTVPEGTASGWHRVNAQGIDMNRCYARDGANPQQGHEPYLVQRDLEAIMASDRPATTVWSMHVWPGAADPSMTAGPEVDGLVGPASELADLLTRHDPNHDVVKPLKIRGKLRPRSKPWTPLPAGQAPKTLGGRDTWSGGPGIQFGVTNFLCEGGGNLYTKQENLDSGRVIIRSLTEYYKGVKPAPGAAGAATQPTTQPPGGR